MEPSIAPELFMVYSVNISITVPTPAPSAAPTPLNDTTEGVNITISDGSTEQTGANQDLQYKWSDRLALFEVLRNITKSGQLVRTVISQLIASGEPQLQSPATLNSITAISAANIVLTSTAPTTVPSAAPLGEPSMSPTAAPSEVPCIHPDCRGGSTLPGFQAPAPTSSAMRAYASYHVGWLLLTTFLIAVMMSYLLGHIL
jgi:hypothetical protein